MSKNNKAKKASKKSVKKNLKAGTITLDEALENLPETTTLDEALDGLPTEEPAPFPTEAEKALSPEDEKTAQEFADFVVDAFDKGFSPKLEAVKEILSAAILKVDKDLDEERKLSVSRSDAASMKAKADKDETFAAIEAARTFAEAALVVGFTGLVVGAVSLASIFLTK